VTFAPDTPALGYVAVDPAHQGKRLSHRIVAALLSKNDKPLADPNTVYLHAKALGIVTAWPRRVKSGSGSHSRHRDGAMAVEEPDGRNGRGAKTTG